MRLAGIYTPVITPFTIDFKIDFCAFESHVQYLLDAGVQGLMIGGTTGEYYVESQEERLELLSRARKICGNNLQILFGTGALNPDESIKLAQLGTQLGADAIVISTPPYSLPTQQELSEHAQRIEKATSLPVVLYNYPDRMGVNMETEFLDTLSDNFCGIKESSGDINRLHMLMSDYPNIQVSCGMDDQALEFFAWGAKSWICAGSNFLPKEHLALYNACVVENNFNKGRQIMAAMMPLMHVLEQGGKFIQSVKYGVEMESGHSANVRRPLTALSDAEKETLADVVATLKQRVADIEQLHTLGA